jgi:phage terminase small subunit
MAKTLTRKQSTVIDALTDKQLAYVDARGRGKGKRAAAAEAGYSNPQDISSDVENSPVVQEALTRERAAYRLVSGLSRQDVLDGFMDAINQAKLLADPNAQIAGWREIAKIHGYYAPEVKRVELSGPQQRKVNQLESMSDEELLKLAALEGEFEEVDGSN